MSINIELEILPDKALKALAQVERAILVVDRRLKSLGATTGSLAANANSAASAYGRMATAVTAVNRATRALPGPGKSLPASVKAPPIQRHFANPAGMLAQLQPAVMAGDPQAAAMANRIRAQQRAVARAQQGYAPNDPASMVAQVIARTRFANIGGKSIGMPLGVDIARLMGAGQGSALAGIMGGAGGAGGAAVGGMAALGPLALAATAAVAGLGAFSVALKSAVDTISSVNKSWLTGGGSFATAGRAAMIGSVLGLGPDAGGRLQASISGGGAAGAAAMMMGANPVQTPFGPRLGNQNLNKIAEAISRMSPMKANAMANAVGMPELANLTLMSKSTRERVLGGMNMSSESMRGVVDLFANINFVVEKVKRISAVALGPTLERLASFFDTVGKLTDTISRINPKAITIFFGAMDFFLQGIERVLNMINSILEFFGGAGKKAADERRSRDRHTEAMNRHSDKMEGGGERARRGLQGGIHAGLNPDYMNNIRNMQFGHI